MTNQQPKLSFTITLQDIYDVLCPSCRDKFLEELVTRAKGPPVKEALRAAFEAPPPTVKEAEGLNPQG